MVSLLHLKMATIGVYSANIIALFNPDVSRIYAR